MALTKMQREYAIREARTILREKYPEMKFDLENRKLVVMSKIFGEKAEEIKSEIKRSYVQTEMVDILEKVYPEKFVDIIAKREKVKAKNDEINKEFDLALKKAKNYIMLGDNEQIMAYLENLAK
jgi:hypothetical protein